jgi:hypothetical protein
MKTEPIGVLLVMPAGWINRHQQNVIECPREENKVLGASSPVWTDGLLHDSLQSYRICLSWAFCDPKEPHSTEPPEAAVSLSIRVSAVHQFQDPELLQNTTA